MELTSLARSTLGNAAFLGRTRHHFLASKPPPQMVAGPVPRAFHDTGKEVDSKRARLAENVGGEFYVDRTCIDCDTCRWTAPSVFKHANPKSAVYHQPETPEERLQALQALLACPTASIHTERPPKDIKDAHNSFPMAVDAEELPGVYYCGYHSEKSYGAASYFITRPEGNILVDSPRYSEGLAKQLEAMGGVRYMFLSHKDDVADHQRFQARFNCERILHKLEVQARTQDVEIKLEGEGPWTFLGSDIDLIFTPGHTNGHVCLHYKKGKGALFSGDHLAGDQSLSLDITGHMSHNWYSVPLQLESIKKLIPLGFTWILPGHGRRRHYSSVEERDAIIKSYLASVKVKSYI